MRMLDKTVRGRKAWTRDSLRPEDYLVRIPEDQRAPLALDHNPMGPDPVGADPESNT